MLFFNSGDKKIEVGEELVIETDGRTLKISDEKHCFKKEYDSVLEILGIMMWIMKNVKKTTVHFTEGTHEFIRKREYRGYKDELRL